MEKTVGERLKWLLDSNNISSREFQRHVSVGEKQVSNWILGVSNIHIKHIVEIANYFTSLNIEWFLLGRGSPYKDMENLTTGEPGVDYELCKCCERLKIKVDLLREENDRKDNTISLLNQELGRYKGNNSVGFRDVGDKSERQIIGGYGRKNQTE